MAGQGGQPKIPSQPSDPLEDNHGFSFSRALRNEQNAPHGPHVDHHSGRAGRCRPNQAWAGHLRDGRCDRAQSQGGDRRKKLLKADALPVSAAAASIGIQASAERDVIIAGVTLVQRFGAAASKYAGKIQAFLESYLITEEALGIIPFGGRDQEFEILDQWLAE